MDSTGTPAAAQERPEILRIAARHPRQDGEGPIRDHALLGLLAGLDVPGLIDMVDGLKLADGEPRSIALYRGWIAVSGGKPDQLFAAWYNLGAQLSAARETAAAAAAFRTAAALKPGLAAAAVNAGLCHETLGDAEGALALWSGALQSDEDRIVLLNHRGRLLESLKRYEDAERSLRASLLARPDQPDAMHHWIAVKTRSCDWPLLGALPGLDRPALEEHLGGLSLLALSDDVALHHRANASWIDRKFPPSQARLSPPGGYTHAKLRIGYLSSDLCEHPMAYLVADLIEQHDRDAFTVYGYCSTKEDGSDVRRRLLAGFDRVTSVIDMTDERAAQAIRDDEIDILIDLNGLTLGTRLPVLRWRPAPVQITYLGYNGAIPMPEIDYIVADRFVIPPSTAARHRPPPLYLPSCYQANDRHLPVAAGETRAAAGLPEGVFVFCCFCNSYKITEEMFEAWILILRRAEDAVLWLYADSEAAQHNLTWRFAASGLAPERLIFASRTRPDVYRARLALADLFLDTFPYNAGTTASDALRVGLPVVTLAGRSFISRMAGSLLHAVGLDEGVVASLDAYVELAADLARDPSRYQCFRDAVAGDAWARTLGDTPRFTREFEAALKSVAVKAESAKTPSAGDHASSEELRPAIGDVSPTLSAPRDRNCRPSCRGSGRERSSRLSPSAPRLKIFVASHVNGEATSQPLYATIRTGAAPLDHRHGCLRDDVGEQISKKNPFYSELTALYWIWKNTTSEKIGLCHYRRYFSPILLPTENQKGAKLDRSMVKRILDLDPTGAVFDEELILADMIVPVRDPRDVSAAELYAHHHRIDDWKAMMSAMEELYPTEAAPAGKFFSEIHPFHYYNMMLTHRSMLDRYCSWLFPLLFHIETLITPSTDRYQARVYGFLAERLFNWWTASRGLKLVERPILQIE